MGSPKALLDFRGETFLDRLIGIFSEVCSPVVVVVGSEADRIRPAASLAERAVFAGNADYPLRQLSSTQAGLPASPQTTTPPRSPHAPHPPLQPSPPAPL